MIRQLKYSEKAYWARALADAALPTFTKAFMDLPSATLVPVPMHRSQYKERRDNHAELLAKRLSRTTGLPCTNNLILKTKLTQRQAELTGKARRKNLKNAFTIQSQKQLPKGPIYSG